VRTALCGPSWALFGIFCIPGIALGSNGLNLIGFGTEAVSMGGADLAVARDTSALNSNPAGLAQIHSHRLDLYSITAFALDVGHRDQYGNDVEVANSPIAGASFGYAQRLPGTSVTLGFGLFGQGGAGYEYPQLTTAFGTRDELSSLFRIAKLSAGGAIEIDKSLSLGASLAATYSDLTQRIFPNTSYFSGSPQTSFFGSQLDDMSGLGYGYKIGLQYRPDTEQTWGVTYTSRVALTLDGGNLVSNQSALGLGEVRYRQATAKGLKLPQELGVGYARQATRNLLWTAELNWLDWSRAMTTSTLSISDPDNPAAIPQISMPAVNNWRDQYVVAVGMEYKTDSGMHYRAGYNYGRNPIPAENLNPLFASIGEHHLTLGAGQRLNVNWSLDAGIEYGLSRKVTYTNPSLPFGPNAQERGEVLVLHATLSRVW
jgi:long-chain fatty acid transport protein